jgi:predicted esterase
MDTLRKAGADVQHRTLPIGHGLSQADVAITKAWVEQRCALRGPAASASNLSHL